MPDPEDRALRQIAGDLRLVGIMLAVLGGLITLVGTGFLLSAPALTAKTILAAGALVLLLPGAWLTVAASLVVGGRGRQIVRTSLRVVCIQATAFAGVIAVVWIDRANWPRHGLPIVSMPAMALIFFLPAQATIVYQLVRARALIDTRDARRGFAVGGGPEVPVAAVAEPVDGAARHGPAPSDRQSESVRGPK